MNTAIKQDYAPTWLQHEPTHPSIALLAADNEPYNPKQWAGDSRWFAVSLMVIGLVAVGYAIGVVG